MNLKPGCKAIIVDSLAGNDGKEVTIIRRRSGADRWEIDPPVPNIFGGMTNVTRGGFLQRVEPKLPKDIEGFE